MAYIGKQPTKAALTSSDIEDGIITAAKIEDGAVVAAEIASNAVTTAKINADAVTGAKIADDVINSEHIVADSIDAEHYAAGSVDTTALGADAVTGAKIADDAINSEHYTDGSIDTAHLADGQVTTAKLATAVFTGATDIGAAIADADLFLMDDGAGGTIRKTTASRIKTYIGGGTNTPTFLVYKNGDQSISANADTKITSYTEIHDPQSTFASNKFTPGVSGKYWIFGTVYLDGTDGKLFIAKLKKNGSTFAESGTTAGTSAGNFPILVSGLIDLDTDDYVELFFQPAANTTAFSSGTTVQFGGYKIIE